MFNQIAGDIEWEDEDKVRQVVTEELPRRVAADPAYQNAIRNSDPQNARIEHDRALDNVLVSLINDHMQLYKVFKDNASFRSSITQANFDATYKPELRRLDDAVRRVELDLRSLIDTTLDGDTQALPQHVTVKAKERVAREVKRDATKDSSDFDQMAKLLEFFDLRELESTIVSKSCWPQFEPKFRNKQTFQQRFSQLAELRNALAHNRELDGVTQKEGEAALDWFEELLGSRSGS